MRTQACGSWPSPFTPAMLASGGMRLGQVALDGEDVYWTEGRPQEAGRVAIMRWRQGHLEEVLAAPWSARSRVHEYGGGAYAVRDGLLYWVNFPDQVLWRLSADGAQQEVLAGDGMRFADGTIDASRARSIWVRETHQGGSEPVNDLVAIGMDASVLVLASGSDFYSNPRISPDGERLGWLAWNHPNMPWDGTELWVASIDIEGRLHEQRCVAGGPEESIFQPEWSPDGRLSFVSDRTGWWNLYLWDAGMAMALCPMEAEFGLGQWSFGESTYAWIDRRTLVVTLRSNARSQLARLDLASGKLEPIDLGYTHYESVRTNGRQVAFLASAADRPPEVVVMDWASRTTQVLRRAQELNVPAESIARPRVMDVPTTGGETCHVLYYSPTHAEYSVPDGEMPPLIVICHGGPTASTSTAFSPAIQFWTSRGFAVADVNYRGSTGYGRTYRRRLYGHWGIVDVDDCVAAARSLVAQGLADGARLIIRGSSAGGYTTLAALTFRDVFKAGASYYGICDLDALNRDTHKFESRYTASLVGPFPERADLYHDRSPIHFTERLNCPIILFQGLDDKVVPPNQAEAMHEAVRAKGLPVAYLSFAGEGHGFRRAETVQRTLTAELLFYSRVFGFPLADTLPAIQIDNLA